MKVCTKANCGKVCYARDLCSAHYQQLRRKGELARAQTRAQGAICKVEECEEPVRCKELCSRHYNYFRRTGKTHKEAFEKELDCSVDGCTRKRRGLGLCNMHYNRFKRTGSTERQNREAKLECSIPNCTTVSHGRGWCEKHYQRWRKGTLTEEVIQHGDADHKPLEHKLEDLEELISFGVTNIEELWTRAGFANEQQMMYHAPKELKERIRLL